MFGMMICGRYCFFAWSGLGEWPDKDGITISGFIGRIPSSVIKTHKSIVVGIEESEEFIEFSLSVVLMVKYYLTGDKINFVGGDHFLATLKHHQVKSLAIGFQQIESMYIFALAEGVKGFDRNLDQFSGPAEIRVFAFRRRRAGGQQ